MDAQEVARDRTLEFFQILGDSQEGADAAGNGNSQVQKSAQQNKQRSQSVSKDVVDFHRTSATVQGVVAAAEKKLARLAKMVERTRTLRSSNEAAMTQLIANVKGDMSQASEAVATLDKLVDHITVKGSQLHDHCLLVVDYLESRTMALAGRFKTLLKRRHAHMKSSSKRKQIFGTEFAQLGQPLRFGNSFDSAAAAAAGGAAPGSETASGAGEGVDMVDIDLTTTSEQSQLQLIPEQDYYQQRSQSMAGIESTIVELGGMFDSLSTMIEAHGETIDDISSNVETSLSHSERAVGELEEAWRNADGNKMLYFKIFLILMSFMAFFITFLA